MSDTVFIFGGRGSGKTKTLVELASKTGATIVVNDKRRAEHMMSMACVMGVPNLSVRRFEYSKSPAKGRTVYVDDAHHILEQVLGCPIRIAAFDLSLIDMRKMTFLDMLAEWRRQRRVEKYGSVEE